MNFVAFLKSLIPRKKIINKKIEENKRLLDESFDKISKLAETIDKLQVQRANLEADILLLKKQAAVDESKIKQLIVKEKQFDSISATCKEFVQTYDRLHQALQTKKNNLLKEMNQVEGNVALEDAAKALANSLKDDLSAEVEETNNEAKSNTMQASLYDKIYNEQISNEEIEARLSQLKKENQ